MKNKKRSKRINFLYYISVIFFVIIILGPIIWAVIVSFTPEYEMFKNTSTFLPKNPTIDNYVKLFTASDRQSKMFFIGIINSIKTAFITIFLCIPCSVMCAYAISKMKFKGRNIVKTLILVSMAIPAFTTIIPLYRMFSLLSLLDNLFSLSLIYVTSFLPINTWMISNYFDTIPVDIEEAAYIDGCNEMDVLFRVMLPISAPIILSAFLLVFLMSWGQFQIPLILASSPATKPISIVASEFVSKDSIQYGITTAAGLLAIFPPALLAIIFRKFLVRGMTGGATK
ncbi:carbohydrate ABC transporter permease [uncultured Brachyspira sp.]|uniref:carbohydrate ABC transporter permease n=1 Tax=uncultured Brachyspira sp. TaxID=221953 RepID=UPI0026237F64|nr:carbohydrate ABC transporter permease [uncultured Brachyspira sp.]